MNLGPEKDKQMMSGLHRVKSISCKGCHECVGWTYVSANLNQRTFPKLNHLNRFTPSNQVKNTKRDYLSLSGPSWLNNQQPWGEVSPETGWPLAQQVLEGTPSEDLEAEALESLMTRSWGRTQTTNRFKWTTSLPMSKNLLILSWESSILSTDKMSYISNKIIKMNSNSRTKMTTRRMLISTKAMKFLEWASRNWPHMLRNKTNEDQNPIWRLGPCLGGPVHGAIATWTIPESRHLLKLSLEQEGFSKFDVITISG